MPTAAELRAYAERRARELGADPQEILAIGERESANFNPNIRDSPRGAIGPMQLMPDTARGLGVNPRDPYQNIDGGIRYYQQQRQRFGSPILAAAAYNAGPGAVRRHGGVPPFRETQDYVAGFPGPRVRRGRGGAAPAAQVANSDDIFGFSGNGGGQGQAAPAPAQAQNSDDIFGFAPERPARQRRPANVPPAPPPMSGATASGPVRPMTPADRQQIDPQALLTFTQTHDPGAVARIAPAPRRTPPSGFSGAQASRTLPPTAIASAVQSMPLLPAILGAATAGIEAGTRAARPGPPAPRSTYQQSGPPGSALRAHLRYGGPPIETANPFTGERAPQARTIVPQMLSNMGVGDELSGGATYLMQGGENLVRRATGQPIEIGATDAYHAAAERDRAEQRQYAQDRPAMNIASSALGVATAGAPNAARQTFLAGSSLAGRMLRGGIQAAKANLPFAAASAEGNPVERIPQVGASTATAFGLGGMLQGVAEGAGALGRARSAAPRSPQRQLSDRGVPLTMGQMAGGAVQRVEDASTSVPLFGDAIRARQTESIRGFNRAALNQTLEPIGGALPKNVPVGREGLRYAETRISDHYRSTLNGVTVAPDNVFRAAVSQAEARVTSPEMQSQLRAVLDDTIGARFSGTVTGDAWKQVDSELSAAIRSADNGSSMSPAMRQLRTALQDVRTAFRSTLERTNPTAYAGVRQADEATANLVRIREASQKTGTARRDGVFTPAELSGAVRAGDSSADNRQFARGDALMQDLTEPGMQVLPPTVPDSGTAIRSVYSMMMPTAAAAAGGGALGQNPLLTALIPLGLSAAGAAVYSKTLQGLLNVVYRAGSPGKAEGAIRQLATLARTNPALLPLVDQLRGSGGQPGGSQGPPRSLPPPTSQPAPNARFPMSASQ